MALPGPLGMCVMPVVLLGESTPDLRAVFTIIFRRSGDMVYSAGDRAGVLRLASRVAPDVIVLNLPGNDGPATCRALRSVAGTAETPVLLLSAALFPDADAARRAGADDYMTKPLGNADLIERVHALTTGRRRASAY
jgi:DNA-binding response OmpR family regulator